MEFASKLNKGVACAFSVDLDLVCQYDDDDDDDVMIMMLL